MSVARAWNAAIGILLLITAACMVDARAQQARSGGADNAQLTQQLQQLASERTELQAQNAKLQKDLDEVRKERGALKTGQQGMQRRADESQAAMRQVQQSVATQRQSSDQEIAKWRSRVDEVAAEERKISEQLQAVEMDRNALKQTITVREQAVNSCAVRNQSLFALNSDILGHFEKESVFSRAGQAQPFAQTERTRLESLIGEDRPSAPDAATGSSGRPR
jgi:chromosome segregation ATPase